MTVKSFSVSVINTDHRHKYLDGLRGWAAVVVVLYHSYSDDYPATAFARDELWKFLPFNGGMAVNLFFFISGFSLSLPFLISRDRRTILKLVAGRYFRLAIPIFGACAVTHILLVTGGIRAPVDRVPFDKFLTLQLSLGHLFTFSFWDVFFAYSNAKSYIPPLWTMSVELIGSVLVLTVQFITGRSLWRWLAYVVLAGWFLTIESYNALFVVGMALADISRSAVWPVLPKSLGPIFLVAGAAQFFVFSDTFMVECSAAFFLFLGILITPAVQVWLSTPTSLFLGKISFPLYLLHSSIMYVISVPLVIAAKGDLTGILLGATAALPVAFLAAVAFVPVNEASIRLSRATGALAVDLVDRRIRPLIATVMNYGLLARRSNNHYGFNSPGECQPQPIPTKSGVDI
jgi:peptidoglycan/LPS O-acetylase OafA/YrhL